MGVVKHYTANSINSPMPKKVATAGSWKPGQSGNPNGRPKGFGDLRELCRSLTLPAVEALEKNLKDRNGSVRNVAAHTLIAYGWGKPAQDVNIKHEGVIEYLALPPEERRKRIEELRAKIIDVTEKPKLLPATAENLNATAGKNGNNGSNGNGAH